MLLIAWVTRIKQQIYFFIWLNVFTKEQSLMDVRSQSGMLFHVPSSLHWNTSFALPLGNRYPVIHVTLKLRLTASKETVALLTMGGERHLATETCTITIKRQRELNKGAVKPKDATQQNGFVELDWVTPCLGVTTLMTRSDWNTTDLANVLSSRMSLNISGHFRISLGQLSQNESGLSVWPHLRFRPTGRGQF